MDLHVKYFVSIYDLKKGYSNKFKGVFKKGIVVSLHWYSKTKNSQ